MPDMLWTPGAEEQTGAGSGYARFTEDLYGAVNECFINKTGGNTVRLFSPGMGEAIIHIQYLGEKRIGYAVDALVFPSQAASKTMLLVHLKREVNLAFNRLVADRKLLASGWDEVTLTETEIKPGRPVGVDVGKGRTNTINVSEPE